MIGIASSTGASPGDIVVCRDSFVDLFRSTAYVGSASTPSVTLNAPAVAGATTLTLTTANSFDVGELVYIDSKSDDGETTIVTATDTGAKTITVSPALTRAHPAGVYVGQVWHNSTHVFGTGDPNTGGIYGRWLAQQVDVLDPGPSIVVLGDSWCEPGASADHDDLGTNPRRDFNELRTSLAARFPDSTVSHIPGGSGDDLSEQLDRWSQVAALEATTVIHMSGFMNDLAGGRTESEVLADCLTLFNNCKDLGAYLIMSGVAPYSADEATAAALKTAVETYVNGLA